MMAVEHVEVLVEELSMEAALILLLPKILGDVSFSIHTHQGKLDLLQSLPKRLAGYAKWIPTTYRIVVVVDQDNDDCKQLKETLEKAAKDAGLVTKSNSDGKTWVVLNRIAVEELEAWYFGDWEAVAAAYVGVPPTIPSKAKYRNPDAIRGGTWEAFERVGQQAGYFGGGLPKVEVAMAVATHMVPNRNRSTSFKVLHAGLLAMLPENGSIIVGAAQTDQPVPEGSQ